MDSKSLLERSLNMSRIRSRDTQPELVVRYLLFHAGYRYRIAPSYVKGHPDLYLASRRTAIFVNGCFWHRHSGCRTATTPKSNTEFWLAKFERNIRRDRETSEALKDECIRVLVIWECTVRKSLKDSTSLDFLRDSIIAFLEDGRKNYLEL